MTLSTQTTTRKTCSLTGLQLASDSKSEERAWVSPSTVLSSGLHRSKNLKTAQFDVKTRGKWYKSNVCQVLMSWTKKMIQENNDLCTEPPSSLVEMASCPGLSILESLHSGPPPAMSLFTHLLLRTMLWVPGLKVVRSSTRQNCSIKQGKKEVEKHGNQIQCTGHIK